MEKPRHFHSALVHDKKRKRFASNGFIPDHSLCKISGSYFGIFPTFSPGIKKITPIPFYELFSFVLIAAVSITVKNIII